jgi:ribosome-binding protein aMBF1 (putative translation factor)
MLPFSKGQPFFALFKKGEVRSRPKTARGQNMSQRSHKTEPEPEQGKTLGQCIREKREERHWSQSKLAEELGVSERSVVRWENNQTFPRDNERDALRKVLGLRTDEFIRPKKAQPPQQDEKKTLVEEIPTVEEVATNEAGTPVETTPLYHSWPNILLPPSEELSNEEIVEYRIPTIKMYKGVRLRGPEGYFSDEKLYVTVNDKPLPYYNQDDPEYGRTAPKDARIYEWGYGGGGPGRLAKSILADYFGEFGEAVAGMDRWERIDYWYASQTRKYEERFKWEIVKKFPEDGWEISSWMIDAWLQKQKESNSEAKTEKSLS